MERERERRIDCVGPAFPFLSLLLSPWPPDLPSASFSSFFTSSRLFSLFPLPSHSFLSSLSLSSHSFLRVPSSYFSLPVSLATHSYRIRSQC